MTAIFDRFKSFSVSLRQRKFHTPNGLTPSPEADLDVGVGIDRVRNLHVDLVESGEARGNGPRRG